MTAPPAMPTALRRLVALGAWPARALAAMERRREAFAALDGDLRALAPYEDVLLPLTMGIDGWAVLERPLTATVPGGDARPDAPAARPHPPATERARAARRPSSAPPFGELGDPTKAQARVEALLAAHDDARSRAAVGASHGAPARRSAPIIGEPVRASDNDTAIAREPRGGPPKRRSTLDAREADAALRRRAAAASAEAGLDAPLGTEADARATIADLDLDRLARGEASAVAARPAPSDDVPSPGFETTVARLLDRLPRRRSPSSPAPASRDRRRVPDRDHARTGGREEAGAGELGDAREIERSPAEAGPLARLLALAPAITAATASRAAAPSPETLPAPAPSRTQLAPMPLGTDRTLPPLLQERLQDDRLAERIDRILRAEARRQGIDLDGVTP